MGNPITLSEYYSSLLILQYLNKVNAMAQVEQTTLPALLPSGYTNEFIVSLNGTPNAGSYQLRFVGSNQTLATVAFDQNLGTLQSTMNATLATMFPTVSATVVVTGTVPAITFEFTNCPVGLQVIASTMNTSGAQLIDTVTFSGGDPIEQMPIEVQDSFNLIGDDTAKGVMLDILGNYVGVSRSGSGPSGNFTLNDDDFLRLIQMAIIRNSAGSSLADIVNYLNQFFPDDVYVFDYKNMNMSYLIDSDIGSTGLVQLMVGQGLLPKPMAVGLSVIVAPTIDEFFGFRTYPAPAWEGTTPFQTYDDYNTDWLWLSYTDSVPFP